MNFKDVQFKLPALFMQVEKPDLHPKKPELYSENPESYPKTGIGTWFDWKLKRGKFKCGKIQAHIPIFLANSTLISVEKHLFFYLLYSIAIHFEVYDSGEMPWLLVRILSILS